MTNQTMNKTITHSLLDIAKIRKDFPVLHQQVNGKPLVYFDNAASAQKPKAVIDRIEKYYSLEHSNIHRGVHYLSEQATQAFEDAREKIKNHLNANESCEIILTKGTTDGINLVASSFGKKFVKQGDEILISTMEHHSNIVPWQMMCEEKGAVLKVIPIDENGEIIWESFEKMMTEKVKLLAITHISNTLGTINPIEKMIAKAKSVGAFTLIDGAQAVPHLKPDVQSLNCDFYVFSGHKLFGPTGTGVLYGKRQILEEMPPYQGGGDMIKSVSFEKTTYNDLPHKFEAGTPNIAGIIGLGAAIDYVNDIGFEAIQQHENELLHYGTVQLQQFENIRFIGEANQKASVISFLIGEIHPYDVGTLLDKMGIAVRTGHHCTEPLMRFYQIPGTVRASFAFYNTKEEIDVFINALKRIQKMFA